MNGKLYVFLINPVRNSTQQEKYPQSHRIFVSAFGGKIADALKGGRCKNSVALYSIVANNYLFRYTTDKSFQINTNRSKPTHKPSEKFTPLKVYHNLITT